MKFVLTDVLTAGVSTSYRPEDIGDLLDQIQVANLMRDLQEELGLSFLFISHDLRMVELIAHDVIVMYLGKVVEHAPSRVLAERRAHPYAQLLWSALEPGAARHADAGAHPVVKSAAESQRIAWELAEQDRPRSGCRFRARCPVYRARGEPEVCRDAEREPVLREVTPGHFAACHFPQL